MALSFDILIIGGGTAGLTLASRLSENEDISILVLEAGADLTKDDRVNEPAQAPLLVYGDTNWGLRTIPQKGLNNRPQACPGGKMLGGSSALNTFMFIPPTKPVVDAWASLGNTGWEYEAFSKSLRNVYTVTNVDGTTNGEGPIQVSYPDEYTQWPRLWSQSVKDLGFESQIDRVSWEYFGAHKFAETIAPGDGKRSFAASYLQLAKDRGNLTVWTDVHVTKVLLEKQDSGNGEFVAKGVQYTQNGETKTVHTTREVILSAGTLFNPQILEASGIGDLAVLQNIGVEVLIDNPNVGENLQNHVVAGLTYEVKEKDGYETLDAFLRQEPKALELAMKQRAERKGPLMGCNMAGGAQISVPYYGTEKGKREVEEIIRTSRVEGKATKEFSDAHEEFVKSNLTSPTQASALYYVFPAGLTVAPDGSYGPLLPAPKRYIGIGASLSHPLSRGSVHSRLPTDDNKQGCEIDMGFLTHPLDVDVLARHVQQVDRLSTETSLSELIVPEQRFPEVGDLTDIEVAREFVKETASMAHHSTGTCAMMPRSMGGVVDDTLRVYGVQNLRVCDLSVVPFPPKGNTQATAYAVGEHGAGIIKPDLKV
ncbi:GMC oxidoreductase [Xylariaceae sp. FL1019]|nr:GMC oxidoreductase [Xylariaceae sp. FL1019]